MDHVVNQEAKKAGRRKVRSLSEEIAAQEEKLRKLREKAKREEQAKAEKNRKAIFDLIRAERLDVIEADKWTAALPQIKKALGSEKSKAQHAPEPSSVAG